MALVKGPFTIKWGSQDVLDVSEIGFNYEVATNDYTTVDGRTYQVEGAITASVELTLLASDVPALRYLLPQYYVPGPNEESGSEGGTLSTGEKVIDPEGAIDIVAAKCDKNEIKYDLEITSCNGHVTRLVKARTTLSTQEFADNSLRTVTITFIGEPEINEDGTRQGIIQFFSEDGIERSTGGQG